MEAVASGRAAQWGDFISSGYETRLRRNPDRVQVQLSRQGHASGVPIRLSKAVTLSAGSTTLEIAYLLEDLPPHQAFHFAVEMNFAGLPAGADDRYFHDADHRRLGQLGTRLDLSEARSLGMVDEWLGIGVDLRASRPTGFWAFPIETVSQSEGGFELVHQSVAVLPHWIVQGDADGRWSVTIHMAVDTSRAEARQEKSQWLVTSG
jgi:alpha-amylase